MSFEETSAGLADTDWTSTPPPTSFPILCPSLSSCGNSLASALYNLAWGARAPLLAEPLLQGTSWAAVGGAANDVSSTSDYLGLAPVTVPAFPKAVLAAEVRTQITQVGALGDPYGSGVRTVWWVYGVGPAKIVFAHSGGSGAAVTTVVLQSTNQSVQPAPRDTNYFPLQAGAKGVYRWTNTRYLKQPELESFTVAQVGNGTAVLDVASVSGPLKVSGAYRFTIGLDGLTSTATDGHGNVSTKTFNVTVRDTTAPALTVSSNAGQRHGHGRRRQRLDEDLHGDREGHDPAGRHLGERQSQRRGDELCRRGREHDDRDVQGHGRQALDFLGWGTPERVSSTGSRSTSASRRSPPRRSSPFFRWQRWPRTAPATVRPRRWPVSSRALRPPRPTTGPLRWTRSGGMPPSSCRRPKRASRPPRRSTRRP